MKPNKILLNLLTEWDIAASYLRSLNGLGEFKSVFEILTFKISQTFSGV